MITCSLPTGDAGVHLRKKTKKQKLLEAVSMLMLVIVISDTNLHKSNIVGLASFPQSRTCYSLLAQLLKKNVMKKCLSLLIWKFWRQIGQLAGWCCVHVTRSYVGMLWHRLFNVLLLKCRQFVVQPPLFNECFLLHKIRTFKMLT